jgi:transcriptional regulator with XRE-family HTH domain
MPTEFTRSLLAQLRSAREAAGISADELGRRLLIGPGWIDRFERAASVPSLDVLVSICQELGVTIDSLVPTHTGLELRPGAIERDVRAIPDGADLLVHFPYATYDAVYRLPNARLEQFERVLHVLRDGLARLAEHRALDESAIKADTVANTFLEAVRQWPHASPSDLWWFVVYRAYCDPFNHPATFARMSFEQSWKRTSGWALELVLVRHYQDFLRRHGVSLAIETGARKELLVSQLRVDGRFEADKVDVLLSGSEGMRPICFGVVHVKASFAERRTDDIPASQALIRAGYASPLWTMDAKSSPSEQPINRGELGSPWLAGLDRRSAKRKDIETDAYFSACFSYNRHTHPTPRHTGPDGRPYRALIEVCDFGDPDDAFSRWVVAFWRDYAARMGI